MVRDFNPGMQSVAMQPVLDAPLVFFMHRLPLLYGPKQSLLSRNNHSFLGPEVTAKKTWKEWNRNANICGDLPPSNQNDNTNQDAMEIFLTDCFCNEELAADQDINLGPIESTTSRVVSDRRSRCCSSFVTLFCLQMFFLHVW